jgi:hypothetical protein
MHSYAYLSWTNQHGLMDTDAHLPRYTIGPALFKLDKPHPEEQCHELSHFLQHHSRGAHTLRSSTVRVQLGSKTSFSADVMICLTRCLSSPAQHRSRAEATSH